MKRLLFALLLLATIQVKGQRRVDTIHVQSCPWQMSYLVDKKGDTEEFVINNIYYKYKYKMIPMGVYYDTIPYGKRLQNVMLFIDRKIIFDTVLVTSGKP